jgi:hypothetical protein
MIFISYTKGPYLSLAPIPMRITTLDLTLSIQLSIVLSGSSPRITIKGDPNPRGSFPSFLTVALRSMSLSTRMISLAISIMLRTRPSSF